MTINISSNNIEFTADAYNKYQYSAYPYSFIEYYADSTTTSAISHSISVSDHKVYKLIGHFHNNSSSDNTFYLQFNGDTGTDYSYVYVQSGNSLDNSTGASYLELGTIASGYDLYVDIETIPGGTETSIVARTSDNEILHSKTLLSGRFSASDTLSSIAISSSNEGTCELWLYGGF